MSTIVNAVDEDRLVSLTQQLIRIDSQYYGEGARHSEITAFLKDLCGSLGFEVHCAEPEEGFPLVVARLRGKIGKPVLAFMGHYNTVPIYDRSKWSFDPLGAEIRNGRIWGRGSADMKQAIAAMIEASRAIMESGTDLKGDLLLVFFAGEGKHYPALEYMVGPGRSYAGADWYIDADGRSGLGLIRGGSMGSIELRIRGSTGHIAYFRDDGTKPVNAISKMVRLLSRIEQIDDWMTYKTHPLFDRPWRYSNKPIFEIFKISGGTKPSSVPEDCVAGVDFRLLPSQTVERFLDELRSLIEKCRSEDPELEQVEVRTLRFEDYLDHWPDPRLIDEHPVVKSVVEVATPILGCKPEFHAINFDRPPLWKVGEVIQFGMLGRANAHSYDESTTIDGLTKTTKIFATLIERLLR